MSILLALAGGLAGGVFLRSLFVFGFAPVAFVLVLAALFGAAAFLKTRKTYALGALGLLFAALGMMRTSLADAPLPGNFTRELRARVSYEGIVVADPDARDASKRVLIRAERGGESAIVLAVVSRGSAVAAGDRVRVTGTLLLPEPFTSDGGRVFRYDKYLESRGVRFMLKYGSVYRVAPAPWYSLRAALARVKRAFIDGINAVVPEPESSLASGIVIGGKSGLGTKLQNAFVKSGLVQIVVLSGYNIMIVAEWVLIAFARLTLARRWSAAAAALAVLLFVGIAGASATALRAMLMAFIALYARATGKSYVAGRALLLVLCLMLLHNPLLLVFDPGFGLSVTATAGLIWLAPRIEALLLWPHRAFWKNALATTLAAQIAVLPLLLYDTGILSLVAIPANVLAMPLVPLSMGLSALAGMAGILFHAFVPAVAAAIAYPAYLANALLILIAQMAAALPLSAVTLPAFPFWLVPFSYALLVYAASSKRSSTTDQLRLAGARE